MCLTFLSLYFQQLHFPYSLILKYELSTWQRKANSILRNDGEIGGMGGIEGIGGMGGIEGIGGIEGMGG